MLTVVIGAGIVGLQIARALQEAGHEVYALDQAPYLAEHSSGRNSGVIHAGIFYRSGSLKEKTCIEGNRLTYEWARRLEVPHKACGKWIVPEPGQENDLEPFYEKIRSLPIPAPRRLTAQEVRKEEPRLRPTDAIFVPSSGIIDAAGYVKALANYLEQNGVNIILNCEVKGVTDRALETSRGPIEFDIAINAAGLQADRIAALAGLPGYEIRPCRGDYYVLNQQPLSKPVYHLPYKGAHGLGVHLTPTLDGETLVGPNAFFIKNKTDYSHHSSSEAFEQAIPFYLPKLKDFRLREGYSGNRPKLFREGLPVDDFVIEKKGNWIHLLGVESPGLTAAPALAQEVERVT